MGSRKKESEGIALLSMYYDEEDDEEMEDAEPQQREEEEEEEPGSVDPSYEKDDDPIIESERTVASDSGNDNSPPVVTESFTPQEVKVGASTPQPVSFTSPPQQQQQQQVAASDSRRSSQGRLTIVDYGHDEVAMSPEAEEGEIESGGHNMFGGELQSSNGDFHEKTPPGTVHILTPATQATTQSPEHREPSESDPLNYAANDSETGEAADPANVSEEEPKDVDPLDKFLPSPPTMKCPFDLQKRIDKFLSLKKTGRSFNAEVRNRKDYRNPDFLLHAVRYQDIDQIGSCFSKDVFDPHGYDKSDYVEEIEADMKREMERKEQERKKNQKVEFVSGGNQPAPPKITMPIPVPPSALHSVPTAVDVSRDGRQNKKSKWDKVDGDRRNPLPSGGQDAVSAVGTHAALLSAANAGSGYTAFAQQRRREAEEKRSGERRFERRS